MERGQAGGLADELEPYVDRAETDRFNRMGDLLRSQRPAPAPGLLARAAARPETEAPAGLRIQVALAVLVGLILLGVAALGSGGSGPLG